MNLHQPASLEVLSSSSNSSFCFFLVSCMATTDSCQQIQELQQEVLILQAMQKYLSCRPCTISCMACRISTGGLKSFQVGSSFCERVMGALIQQIHIVPKLCSARGFHSLVLPRSSDLSLLRVPPLSALQGLDSEFHHEIIT